MKSLSLSRQLTLFMGLLILGTVLLTAVSGFWLLDRQVRERLGDTPQYQAVRAAGSHGLQSAGLLTESQSTIQYG